MTAILTNVFGFLHVVEPFIQSALTTWVGFRTNQDVWAFIYLGYFLSFGVVSMRTMKAEQRRKELKGSEFKAQDEEENLLVK